MKNNNKIFFLIFLILGYVICYSQNVNNIQISAVIKSLIGNSEVNPATGKWIPARVGMRLKMGWDIKTMFESSVEIELATGTIIKIGENSVISLSKMILDKNSNTTNSNIKIGTGKVWANVKKLVNVNSSFEFETPTAVASIRGTKLGIFVDKAETKVDVYEGIVMVRPAGKKGGEVAVSSNGRAIVTTFTKAITIVNFNDIKKDKKGEIIPVDPFKDTLEIKRIDALLDSTRLASDTSIKIEVISPLANATLKETPVLLRGKTIPNAGVEINGKEVAVNKDGSFSSLIDLILGKNTVVITAKVKERITTKEIELEYHPELFLNVTNIIDNMTVNSSELVLDIEVSEGAKFSVNGKEGINKITLSEGKNIITVKAWDNWNAKVEKTFAVSYIKKEGVLLNVLSPKDQSSVKEPMISVSGNTASGAKVFVNGNQITVSGTGFFSYLLPIPDEPNKEFIINVTAKLNDMEVSEERVVFYNPPKAPLTLTITSPVEGQVIKQNIFKLIGKTNPKAKVTVNGRIANVSTTGVINYDLQFNEANIGDYFIEIIATDDSAEITKSIYVKVDPTSPVINTSEPTLSIPMLEGTLVTRSSRLPISVTDKTPEDQITLIIENNGSKEEFQFVPGEQQYFNLEEGKNVYTITAYDLARNKSRTYQGKIYYLPNPLQIEIIEPSSYILSIEDLPPGPPIKGNTKWISKIMVDIEIDDGIRNVPETIRDVRIRDDKGNTFLMINRQNYRYYAEVPVNRGYTKYTIVATDITGRESGTKSFSVNVK
jgi:hypothetical protein